MVLKTGGCTAVRAADRAGVGLAGSVHALGTHGLQLLFLTYDLILIYFSSEVGRVRYDHRLRVSLWYELKIIADLDDFKLIHPYH